MFDYVAYARELRHELHQCPEIGFDLKKTLAIVKRELDAMGIHYTEKYGKSSVVATINEGKGFRIGLRADMDALPIQENSENPFKSKVDGQMHACGHDAHTANLLATARKLNDMKDELRCTIKLLFTPAEEYINPGIELMVKDGVDDEIDVAVALHVNSSTPVGKVQLIEGGLNANSMGVEVEFFGVSSHASAQQRGVDAIRMAVEAYMAYELIVAKEVPAIQPCLVNVGTFHGGNTNNIICDYTKMYLSVRTQDDDLSEFVLRRIREISDGVASMCGGKAKVTVKKFLPYVKNDPVLCEKMKKTIYKVLGENGIQPGKRGMGGEDFAFLSRKKPCLMIRWGSRNPEDPKTHYNVHNDHFDIDERCFETGIALMSQFVIDYQDGIEF